MTLVYLAKNGVVSGPFTSDELARIQGSSEIQNYSWVWKGHWMPTDPAPLEDPSQIVSKLSDINSTMSVVCHDFKRAISGILSEVKVGGCVLVVGDETQAVRFQDNSIVHMNLLIEKTKQSMNFPVRFLRLLKVENGWNYHFQWSQVPCILLDE